MPKQNIVLIGMMGAGKTAVGTELAKKISANFVDTDQYIEQSTGKTISSMFQEQGESWFRQLEHDMLDTIQMKLTSSKNRTVLSTGGGIVTVPENKVILQNIGTVIYLKASAETLIHRLESDDTRPLLKGDDKKQKIETLLNDRQSLYKNCAHHIVSTDSKSISNIVDDIIALCC